MDINSSNIIVEGNELNIQIWLDSTISALKLALEVCDIIERIKKANEPVPISDVSYEL